MSEHTKEPWAGKEIPLTAVGLARAGFGIVFTNHTATRDEAEANARRIVASVNACAGIPTDVLEAMPSGPSSLLPMYAQIEQQRDKLLAALESLLLITADSEGVAGYHLNGAVANWDEFPEVNEAALLVAQMKGQS
jgi:hypothetical protein